MLFRAESIRPVARKREPDGHNFSTSPGSPFRALTPNVHPEVEPKCHRGKNKEYFHRANRDSVTVFFTYN